MTSTTLISAKQLMALHSSLAALVVLDCRFDLADPEAGARSFALGHVGGAHYAHLDHDLAGSKTGSNGRHPLPDRDAFAATLGRWGVAPDVQVVTYDAQGGVYAARAWWMLRWMGHATAAVLDGGVDAWRAEGGVMNNQATVQAPGAPYPGAASLAPTVDAPGLLASLTQVCVLDARAPERFRGDVEPLDPVAGHIPGARNHFFKDNLQADGRFKPAAELRAAFEGYGNSARQVVHQCGSGVTACHNLLAMAHAGLHGSVLYPGSWSEWCADPARPVARD